MKHLMNIMQFKPYNQKISLIGSPLNTLKATNLFERI